MSICSKTDQQLMGVSGTAEERTKETLAWRLEDSQKRQYLISNRALSDEYEFVRKK